MLGLDNLQFLKPPALYSGKTDLHLTGCSNGCILNVGQCHSQPSPCQESLAISEKIVELLKGIL